MGLCYGPTIWSRSYWKRALVLCFPGEWLRVLTGGRRIPSTLRPRKFRNPLTGRNQRIEHGLMQRAILRISGTRRNSAGIFIQLSAHYEMLEEFERPVGLSYMKDMTDNAKDRQCDFIVQNSLCESSEGKDPPSQVCPDEGESNELALFLTGPSTPNENSPDGYKGLPPDTIKNSFRSSEKSWA